MTLMQRKVDSHIFLTEKISAFVKGANKFEVSESDTLNEKERHLNQDVSKIFHFSRSAKCWVIQTRNSQHEQRQVWCLC